MDTQKRKFCAGCQKFRLLTEGELLNRGKRNRWVCFVCQDKRNISPYATKAKREQLIKEQG